MGKENPGKRSTLQITFLDVASAALVALLFLIAAFTFACNDLCQYLATNVEVIPGGIYTLFLLVLASAFLIGLVTGTISRIILLLSWILFLPSVLYFSRFDLLSALVPGGFELLSGSLSLPAITIAGLILTSGTIAHGSLIELKALRVSYVSRGASEQEADAAIGKNLLMVVPVIAASVILAAFTALLVTFALSFLQQAPTGSDYLYLIFTIAGAAVIALIIMTYLWSKRA